MKYDVYRPRKGLPKLEKMLTNQNCGFMGGKKNTKWCEKGCCLSDHCVDSKVCETRSDLVWNSVPQKSGIEYRLDLKTYKQGEACDFSVGESDNFNIFDRHFVKKILSGKKLFFIGDSHARNMFVTLISWIKNDYNFHPDFHPSGIHRSLCPGYYDLMYNINCVTIMENRNKRVNEHKNYFVYEDEAHDFTIKYTKAGDPTPEAVARFDEINKEIKGTNCYFILSQGLHHGFSSKPSIDRLRKFDENCTGTFVTSPWLGFAHGLVYKKIQNQVGLERMISDVEEYLKTQKNKKMLNFNEVTRNLLSMDGVHYSFKVHKVLLTIYLNGLI